MALGSLIIRVTNFLFEYIGWGLVAVSACLMQIGYFVSIVLIPIVLLFLLAWTVIRLSMVIHRRLNFKENAPIPIAGFLVYALAESIDFAVQVCDFLVY